MAPAAKKASTRGVKKEDQKAAASGGFAKLFAVKPAEEKKEKEDPPAAAEQPEKAKPANSLQKLFSGQAKTAPAEVTKPEAAKPNCLQEALGQAPSPARSVAQLPAAPAAAKSTLTQEQLAKIEENKRKAKEKQQAKRAREEAPSPKVEETPSPQRTTSRPVATSPGQSVVTPEKVTQERRPTLAQQQQSASTPEVIPPGTGRFAAAALECKNWLQYHDLYALRLKQLKRRAQEEAQSLWGGVLSPESFLTEITGYKRKGEAGEVVLVGLLSKELKGRANVIEQYKDVKVGSLGQGSEAEALQRLNTEEDTLWLEDSTMRLQLQMTPEQVAEFPTGIVVGVRGTAMADGKFAVKAHCFPRMASPPPLPAAGEQGRFLALVSGLAFGKEEGADGLASARASALDFFLKSGERGEAIERLLVCGGTFSHGSNSETGSISKAALQEADEFFAGLAASVCVEVMPGRGDPTNLCLPQMPLHSLLFKRVRGSQNFKSVSNPYECTSVGLTVLGHSGQPVDDILRCTSVSSPLAALELCVRASHLAPTAPDTLPTQPFSTGDPFLLATLPHILFSAGHSKAEHRWHPSEEGTGGTLCACVPAFHQHPAVVLVNLNDPRDVRVQEFGEAVQDARMGQEQGEQVDPQGAAAEQQEDARMSHEEEAADQPDVPMETAEAATEA